jgi:alpha-pyrone synthase
MLSASVLFVIERMLLRCEQDSSLDNLNNDCQTSAETTRELTGLAFSFSPGVGIEGLLFQKL